MVERTYRQLLHGSTLERTLFILARTRWPALSGAQVILLLRRLVWTTVEGRFRRVRARQKVASAGCLCHLARDCHEE